MRDARLRCLTDRTLFRRPVQANCYSIVTRVFPYPGHQHTRKRAEAREKTEHEQHGPDAEEPTVEIPCREHDRTYWRKVMYRLTGL